MSEENETIRSYPKIHAIGHREIRELFNGPVLVEEMVDGSQFSFGVKDGQLFCRSKGASVDLDFPQQMFARAVEVCKGLVSALPEGWVYRGEYLNKPKHNALAYERIPKNHIALFDIQKPCGSYVDAAEKQRIAKIHGFETAPVIHEGTITEASELFAFLDRVSFLGNVKIEGVVVKNYAHTGSDGEILLGKHVSEGFKEVHRKDWKGKAPSRSDVIERLRFEYQCKGRWQKALQHLAERGELDNSPRDIGALIKESQLDIIAECEDDIKQRLWDAFKKDILSGAIRGLPEWYTEKLAASQFEEAAE